MKRGAIESPKILDLGDWLADRLDLPTGLAKTLAVGMLERLWQHTARQTPAGDIGKMSNRRIAGAVDWPHGPDELIGVLVKLRLLDEHPTYRLLVHDWRDHADNYADRHLADSGILYACGASPRNKPRRNTPGEKAEPKLPQPPDSHPHAGDCQKTGLPYSEPDSDSDSDHRTHSSASADAAAAPGGADRETHEASSIESGAARQAAEAKPVKPTRKPAQQRHEYSAAFELVWAAYGRRGTKGAAAWAFASAVKALKGRDGPEAKAPEQWLLDRATLFASVRPEAKYRPHLERWLRDAGFDFDEDAERAAARSSGSAKPDWRAERREREHGGRDAPQFDIETIDGGSALDPGGTDD